MKAAVFYEAERLEVEEVAGVLLHRPTLAVAPRQHFARQPPQQLFEPRRRPAHALDDVWQQLDGQRERELAADPQ